MTPKKLEQNGQENGKESLLKKKKEEIPQAKELQGLIEEDENRRLVRIQQRNTGSNQCEAVNQNDDEMEMETH